MQSVLKPPYLRVRTPQTTNGTDLKIDEETEKVVYKETHLPLTAKKFMEAENTQLPKSLQHKLDVVGVDSQGPTIPEGKKIEIPDPDGYMPAPEDPIKTVAPNLGEGFQKIGEDLKKEKTKK